MRHRPLLLLLPLLTTFACGGGPTPEPSATPSASATPTPTASGSPTPTAVAPTPSGTSGPTPTAAAPTPTPTASGTPTGTATFPPDVPKGVDLSGIFRDQDTALGIPDLNLCQSRPAGGTCAPTDAGGAATINVPQEAEVLVSLSGQEAYPRWYVPVTTDKAALNVGPAAGEAPGVVIASRDSLGRLAQKVKITLNKKLKIT